MPSLTKRFKADVAKQLKRISNTLITRGWLVLDTSWMRHPRLKDVYTACITGCTDHPENNQDVGYVRVRLTHDGSPVYTTLYMPTEKQLGPVEMFDA